MKKINFLLIASLSAISSVALAADSQHLGNYNIPNSLVKPEGNVSNNSSKHSINNKKIINLNKANLDASYSTYGKIINQTTLISKEIKLAEEKLKLAKINKELEKEGGQTANISASSITLDGVFGTKGNLTGLISLDNGRALSVKQGQKIYNIDIINISDNSITLSRNGIISKIPLITLSVNHNSKNLTIKKK